MISYNDRDRAVIRLKNPKMHLITYPCLPRTPAIHVEWIVKLIHDSIPKYPSYIIRVPSPITHLHFLYSPESVWLGIISIDYVMNGNQSNTYLRRQSFGIRQNSGTSQKKTRRLRCSVTDNWLNSDEWHDKIYNDSTVSILNVNDFPAFSIAIPGVIFLYILCTFFWLLYNTSCGTLIFNVIHVGNFPLHIFERHSFCICFQLQS